MPPPPPPPNSQPTPPTKLSRDSRIQLPIPRDRWTRRRSTRRTSSFARSAAAQAQVNEAHSSPRCARPPLQLYASALPLTSFSPAHDSAPSPSFIRSTRRARVPSVWGRCERASQPSSTSKYLALYDQPCTVAGQYTATRTLKSAVRDLIDGHASLAPILSAPS